MLSYLKSVVYSIILYLRKLFVFGSNEESEEANRSIYDFNLLIKAHDYATAFQDEKAQHVITCMLYDFRHCPAICNSALYPSSEPLTFLPGLKKLESFTQNITIENNGSHEIIFQYIRDTYYPDVEDLQIVVDPIFEDEYSIVSSTENATITGLNYWSGNIVVAVKLTAPGYESNVFYVDVNVVENYPPYLEHEIELIKTYDTSTVLEIDAAFILGHFNDIENNFPLVLKNATSLIFESIIEDGKIKIFFPIGHTFVGTFKVYIEVEDTAERSVRTSFDVQVSKSLSNIILTNGQAPSLVVEENETVYLEDILSFYRSSEGHNLSVEVSNSPDGVTTLIGGDFVYKSNTGFSGDTTVILRIFDAFGNELLTPVYIEVTPNLAPKITLDTSSIFENDASKVITATTWDVDGSVVEYLWEQISGDAIPFTFNENVLTVNSQQAGNYVFQFTATDNDGASSFKQVMCVIKAENTPPTVTIDTSNSIEVPPYTFLLSCTAFDLEGPVTYLWEEVGTSNATFATPTQRQTSTTVSVAEDTVFKVTVTDERGLTASQSVVFDIYDANEVLVEPMPNQIVIAPDTDHTFTPTLNSSQTLSYYWEILDGPTGYFASIPSPNTLELGIVDLQILGLYTVQLTVTRSNGSSSTHEILITVRNANQAPVIDTIEDAYIFEPTNTFEYASVISDDSGNYSILWSYQGPSGNSATIQNPTSQVLTLNNLSVLGDYDVTLTVTDDENAVSSENFTLRVLPQYSVNIGDDVTITSGDDLAMTVTFTDEPGSFVELEYTWTIFENGVPVGTATTRDLNYPNLPEGNYWVVLQVRDSLDTVLAQDDAYITVAAAGPTVEAGGPFSITAENFAPSITFTDAAGGGLTFLWEVVSQPSGTAALTMNDATLQNPMFGNIKVGTYSLKVTATDVNGAQAVDYLTIENVNAPGTVAITLDINGVLTTGNQQKSNSESLRLLAVVNDSDSSQFTYLWETDQPSISSFSPNPNGPVVDFSTSALGIVIVSVTVTDATGNSFTNSITVETVHPNVAPTISAGNNATVIPNWNHVMNASMADGDDPNLTGTYTFLWEVLSTPSGSDLQFGPTNILRPTFRTSVSGAYDLRVTVTDEDGNSATSTVTYTVQ